MAYQPITRAAPAASVLAKDSSGFQFLNIAQRGIFRAFGELSVFRGIHKTLEILS